MFRDVTIVGDTVWSVVVFRDVTIVVGTGGAAQGSGAVGPAGGVTSHGTALELANGSGSTGRGRGLGRVHEVLGPGGKVRGGVGEVEARGMEGDRGRACGAKGSG